MYGIFTYIWLIFMVHVGKYTIHGSYGLYYQFFGTAVCYRFCASKGRNLPKELWSTRLRCTGVAAVAPYWLIEVKTSASFEAHDFVAWILCPNKMENQTLWEVTLIGRL